MIPTMGEDTDEVDLASVSVNTSCLADQQPSQLTTNLNAVVDGDGNGVCGYFCRSVSVGEQDDQPMAISLTKIYSIASRGQKISLMVACGAAAFSGLLFPAFVLTLGHSVKSFGEGEDEMLKAIQLMAVAFVVIGEISCCISAMRLW
mmetsp:Transcript_39009/g.44453  ORF Transcript_39009/g.44453 Transcript_39009/m.44453 type:complete len:147 (-) Transcript_39009:175-615(-)